MWNLCSLSATGVIMLWKNNQQQWGLISIIIHWLTAVTVIGLFILGLWMVELTYYDSWYRTAPHIHKSIGLLLFFLTLFRFIWRLYNQHPSALPTHTALEQWAAKVVHNLLYVLLLLLMISGYLISTADGRAIEVFNWFEIPALIHGIDEQEDIAGKVHYWLAMTLIALVLLHLAGAVKHHIIDKDNTLKRMIGRS